MDGARAIEETRLDCTPNRRAIVSTVVPLRIDEHTTILVEAGEPTLVATGSGIEEAASAGDAAERAIDTAQDLAGSIRTFCERIVRGFQEIEASGRPDRASVEFGLDVSIEGNVYVVKGSGTASVRVTAEWELKPTTG
jgi:hypothetical protein